MWWSMSLQHNLIQKIVNELDSTIEEPVQHFLYTVIIYSLENTQCTCGAMLTCRDVIKFDLFTTHVTVYNK